VLVREDLPRVTQLVQAAHAACEAGRRLVPIDADHPHFVVAGVPDELALMAAVADLSAAIPHVVFREEDLGGAATAAAFGPVRGAARRPFRSFRLLKDQTQTRTGRPAMTVRETKKNVFGVEVHSSRWGWHPVGYPDFLLLRRLKKEYFRALRAAAQHHRWERKLPKNRKGAEPPYSAAQYRLIEANKVADFSKMVLDARTPVADPDRVPNLERQMAYVRSLSVDLLDAVAA